jgi:hypothetical protein
MPTLTRPSTPDPDPDPDPDARACAGQAGKDCQEMYQPAAAAEQRLRARLAGTATPVAAQPPAPPPQTAQPGPPSSSAAPTPPEQQALNAAALLSDEAKGFLRDQLLAEKRAREQELTEAAWQTLE